MNVEASLYRPLKKQYVQCTACEHYCAIAPGAVGKCAVRRNVAGTLVLTVYGEAASLHVDPIEKKPLYHFLPAQPILSLGTVGCSFTCQFCQNWQISQAGQHAPYHWPNQVAMPADLVSHCLRHHIPMIAFTYNEPAVFLEYALDTARLAHQQDLRMVLVSSGFETGEALAMAEPHLDAINFDLKSFSERFYRTVCGARLAPVMRNIEHIVRRTRIWIEITTLVIPGLNDSHAELREMAAWLASLSRDLPWHLSAFHPDYHMLDRPPTPKRTLVDAWKIGKAAGLNYVYAGNVCDERHASTFCSACGKLLVQRNWYDVRVLWDQPGVCPACHAVVPGVWT